ncbi:MAG: MAPEG family protein [Hyphomonadaceae bacterium]|nr:MAPEG family protein [Hyphomonadaceae bacterium]
MTPELTMLAWTLVLAFVQILLFDVARTGQYGLKWNVGARDAQMPALSPVAERLKRAQDNLFETLPLFIAAILIAHVADRNGPLTAYGAQIYLAGRVLYVPLYAFGVPVLRSLVWLASTAGLGMVVWALLGV